MDKHTFRFWGQAEGNAVYFNADESKHMQVLRCRTGDALEAFDGSGHVYRCCLQKLTPKQAHASIVAMHYEARPPTSVSVALGVQSGTTDEHILRSLTELGVASFIFFRHQHDAQAKINAARLARWRKITLSACKQCKRAWLPELSLASDWHNLTTMLAQNFTTRLALHKGGEHTLSDMWQWPSSAQVCILVGAACGFSIAEVKALQAVPVKFINLGLPTLRTATAAVFFTGLVNFWQQEKLS